MTKIIVEFGQNHMGNLDTLVEMVEEAQDYADILKFQYWNVDGIYRKEDVRYKNAKARELDFDELYYYLCGLEKPVALSVFGANEEQWKRLWANESIILKYASSEFDYFKADYLAGRLEDRFVVVSLGYYSGNMADLPKINGIYMACTPEYPEITPIKTITQFSKIQEAGLVAGYSDHSIGIHSCKTAVQLGAAAIEKHYTTSKLRMDSSTAFRDHICSMTISELTELKQFRDSYITMRDDKDFITKDKEGYRRLKTW